MTKKSFNLDVDQNETRSVLNQLVDIVAQDVSSSVESATRRKYQVFVTGGVGPGVTSSLFQTVYDQDNTLQTSNPMFDLTYGIFSGSTIVSKVTTGEDSNGKILFPSTSIMMREKISIYSQYAQLLLGNANSQFSAPFGSATESDKVNSALFVHFKRLFARDGIRPETFAMKFFQTGIVSNREDPSQADRPTINITSNLGSKIYTDNQATTTIQKSSGGGSVGNLSDSTNSARYVGNIFYNHGVVMLDLERILSSSQHVSGVISGLRNGNYRDAVSGQVIIGNPQESNPNATYVDLMTSASIDDFLDHIAGTRFGDSATVSMTFQNRTEINSTLFFCHANANEFNFSSNPTYTDSDGRINIIPVGNPNNDVPFSFITTIGLYDAADELLAVAKLSRPIEKNPGKQLTFRVRLDF